MRITTDEIWLLSYDKVSWYSILAVLFDCTSMLTSKGIILNNISFLVVCIFKEYGSLYTVYLSSSVVFGLTWIYESGQWHQECIDFFCMFLEFSDHERNSEGKELHSGLSLFYRFCLILWLMYSVNRWERIVFLLVSRARFKDNEWFKDNKWRQLCFLPIVA